MTFREAGHITKDGWILLFMATTLGVSALSVGMGVWTFYAPVSQSAFVEYKDGVRASGAKLDARLDRMEGKLDEMNDYLRGIPVSAHGSR